MQPLALRRAGRLAGFLVALVVVVVAVLLDANARHGLAALLQAAFRRRP